MTARQRSILDWLLAGGVGVLVSLGMTWGSLEYRVSDKLDSTRFVSDSIRREERDHARDQRIEVALEAIQDAQRETNLRLREIACPPNARGCR